MKLPRMVPATALDLTTATILKGLETAKCLTPVAKPELINLCSIILALSSLFQLHLSNPVQVMPGRLKIALTCKHAHTLLKSSGAVQYLSLEAKPHA